MKQHRGIWLPDHEEHLVGQLNDHRNQDPKDPTAMPVYQRRKQILAMKYVKQHRTAVDIGAHCGLWSMNLVPLFNHVNSFEPVDEHRECFVRNVTPRGTNYTLHGIALGAKEQAIRIQTVRGSSGDSHVELGGDIPMKTLDSFELEDVDFIKLDCEGYELYALQGAEKTLLRYKPCVIVEQKPGNAVQFGLGERDALPYLTSLGAVQREAFSGDFIFTWN